MEELLQQIRTRYPFVKIWAFESSDRVELQQIEVPPEYRGSGIGTKIIQELQNYARSIGKPIVLRPEPERGKKTALERFYKRLGFVNNAGRHRDYTLSTPFSKTMYWKFKEWLQIHERTLYHGTIIDNEPSIRKYGLQGGWHGPLGSFVSQYYDSEEYEEPTEEDEVVFAADKESLSKSVSAMVHHIGKKLNKDFHDVTDNDIRNHGLLVIIKDGSDGATQYSYKDRRWAYENPPRGAEDGDYFASSLRGDIYLRGAGLIRFLKRHGEWPRNWGVGSTTEREKYYRGRLGAMAISRGHEKSTVLDKIKNAHLNAVQDQLKKWESVEPKSTNGIGIRYIHNDGSGLMNNNSLDYNKLDDDEYSEVEYSYLGLRQPPSWLHNQRIIFVFTPDGEWKHRRLIGLLTKASKRGVHRKEIDLSDYQIEWDSGDGQLGLKKI